jgi:hypothetical protein
VPLRRLDDPGALGLGDEQADLLLRHALPRLLPPPEQPEEEPGGDLEQPHRRRGDAGQRRHRRGHGGGDALGVAQRDLLGHELADDQREVGDHRDHDGHADRLGGAGPQAERPEVAREVPGQGGAAEGAGEHADQRDADLHAGEEAALVLEQAQGGAGPGVPGVGHGGEPRPAGGDDRELGHGEEAVEDDQEGDGGELQGEHDVRPEVFRVREAVRGARDGRASTGHGPGCGSSAVVPTGRAGDGAGSPAAGRVRAT